MIFFLIVSYQEGDDVDLKVNKLRYFIRCSFFAAYRLTSPQTYPVHPIYKTQFRAHSSAVRLLLSQVLQAQRRYGEMYSVYSVYRVYSVYSVYNVYYI